MILSTSRRRPQKPRARRLSETRRAASRVGAILSILAAILSQPACSETTICTQITTIPWTITAPGVYCLISDLSAVVTYGSAIQINASDVTLDLNRHALTNFQTAVGTFAIGISAYQQRNVVIKNGSVQGFWIGVALLDASPYTTMQDSVIEDMDAERNLSSALYVQGQGNLVWHNRATQTVGASGAAAIVASGPNNIIRNNEVVATAGTANGNAFAIWAYLCNGLIVEDNRIIGVAAASASAVTIGVYVLYSSQAVIRGNTVESAGTSGATAPRSHGIALSDSSDGSAVIANRITGFDCGICAFATTGGPVQTTDNVVIGALLPVWGTAAATTY
jgi:hypothetical protein